MRASPIGAALDLCPLPPVYWVLLAIMVAGYATAVTVTKGLYLMRCDTLL